MFKTRVHSPLHVYELFEKYHEVLELHWIEGREGSKRAFKVPEVERPGLTLSGYLKGYAENRILIFGQVEIDYLKDLGPEIRLKRLKGLLTKKIPAVIISRGLSPPTELRHLCKEEGIPLFGSTKITMELFNQLALILSDEFAPSVSCHGTLVEAFDVGLLIQGDSSIGKSEAALGLIERGHRLISDDVVKIKKREGSYLEGFGPDLTRHLLEIRGIGIINVANLYGAVCISEKKRVDLIVKLEEWDDNHFYDRVGLEEQYCDILGVKVLYHVLPVKPGRDVVLLLETIVLNYRLKGMGYNSAKEFNVKLLQAIAQKEKGD